MFFKKTKFRKNHGYSFATIDAKKKIEVDLRATKSWLVELFGVVVFIEKEPKRVGVKGCATVLLTGILFFTVYQILLTRQSIEDNRYATNLSIISNEKIPDSVYVNSLNQLHEDDSFDSLYINRFFLELEDAPYINFQNYKEDSMSILFKNDLRVFLAYHFYESKLNLRVINSNLSRFESQDSFLNLSTWNSDVHFFIENTRVNHVCMRSNYQNFLNDNLEHEQIFGRYEIISKTDLSYDLELFSRVRQFLSYFINYYAGNRSHYVVAGEGSNVFVSDCLNSQIYVSSGIEDDDPEVIERNNKATFFNIANSEISSSVDNINFYNVRYSNITLGAYGESSDVILENVIDSKIYIHNILGYRDILLKNSGGIKVFVYWGDDCNEIEKAIDLNIDDLIVNTASCVEGKLFSEPVTYKGSSVDLSLQQ